ncbi:hypothetical protein MLD38_003583 [Melastoma candidum]|uniref:Uncharacterized protein n=1 Tax=Melastoma candidum TaxID=119954 RepID=A0ACB9S2X1_9MYRT|nr:hypothetical protein MLD38_003583 [Melastoma candidum]
MGFDNECIVNIQSLAGEYFCPVCRLLVNPNEALQSQCTHLYCKPCLSYIANSSRACPYDGYLVTESDSKLLTESNRALAESIGKVPVHCLYHRSGCTWQGPLSECLNHCPGCAFGNSPVVCNRCGIQIVHRQVLEHAQTCPGVQTQPPAEGSQLAGVSSAADQSLNLKNTGTSNSQAPVSQTAMPGPMSNPQITSAQVPVAGQTIVPTPEQWYQQQQHQYQQYYQQYVGYDLYQQQYQQYYPYQAQEAQVQPQPQSQVQPQPQSQVQVQPQPQPLVHGQHPGQQQLLMQRQTHAPAVAIAPPSYAQVQPTMPPPSQLPSQVQPSQLVTLSITQHDSQPAHYPTQPFMQAVTQVPPNQQSLPQMPQPGVQPMINPSLQHQPSTAPQVPSQTPPAVVIQHPHLPANQQVIAQTHGQRPLSQAVTDYQSYPQAQPYPGSLQPLPILVQPNAQPHLVQPNTQPHLVQNQAQFPQPPPQARPFRPHIAVPHQQQSSVLPSPAQLPGVPTVQQQLMRPPSQQPGLPVPQHTVTRQYPQQIYLPQKQPLGGQSAVVQNSQSVHQAGPQSLPPQVQHGAFPNRLPNAIASVNLRAPNQSRNLIGRPVTPQMFPHMAVPANSHAISAGFNLNVNSKREVHLPSEQQPSGNLHSKPEKNANGQHVDLLSKATIVRDDASSSLGNDGQQGFSEVGECKQSDASAYESQEPASLDDAKDRANPEDAHDITDSNGDQKDVIGIKYEEKPVHGEKKWMDGFTASLEDGKPAVHMVTSLHNPGNGTKAVNQSGQEEEKLAHAQALVNSFGQEASRQHVSHPSQLDLTIDHELSRNSQHHSIMGHKNANSALKAEKFFYPRLGYMDGGSPDPRFLGSMEPGVFGQPSDFHSNRSRVKGPPAVGPVLESFPGGRSDLSFIEPPHPSYDRPISHEDQRKFHGPHYDVREVGSFGYFPSGSPLRSSLAGKPFNGHNPDWPGQIAASSRNFQTLGPNVDMVERSFGRSNDHIQRVSSWRMPGRHLESVPGQSNIDSFPAHNPGREYPDPSRNAFRDLTGLPLQNLGPELDRGEPYRSNHFFPESKSLSLHGPFQKEFGEIRNLRMGELARNGDQRSHNLMHSDFQRGHPGSRHFRLGEPASLGSSRDLARELIGRESFGNIRMNHPQFLEPRFRSNISSHGFLNDGKYPGDSKPFDNSRKRQAGSMGWCRICKVDCETVEGLEMHSQTREHQKAAIDIVRSFKQQNAKKLKLSTNQAPAEDAGKVINTSAAEGGNEL